MQEVVIEAARSSPNHAGAFIWITVTAVLGLMIAWRIRTTQR